MRLWMCGRDGTGGRASGLLECGPTHAQIIIACTHPDRKLNGILVQVQRSMSSPTHFARRPLMSVNPTPCACSVLPHSPLPDTCGSGMYWQKELFLNILRTTIALVPLLAPLLHNVGTIFLVLLL